MVAELLTGLMGAGGETDLELLACVFPRIAELRELAGAGKESELLEVEAQAAFQSVIRHLEREGVMAGMKALPERTRYSVRQCGGLELFNSRLQVRYGDDENPSEVDDRGPQFLQRDFIAAYKSFATYKAIAPELERKLLPVEVQKFLDGPRVPALTGLAEQRDDKAVREEVQEAVKRFPKVPEPLTDAQLRDRREMLRQQAASLASRKNAQGETPYSG